MHNVPEIDMVYLWVDGNDPQWKAKHDSFLGIESQGDDVDGKGRYANHDELKYSLRSVEKYAPWIRRIYIVTDGQAPSWLDLTNPRVQIVDHSEIMPPECLPCFNSVVIEHHLHNIPGLAEHFIYANDDMFFNQPVVPGDFFAEDGFPIIRMNFRMLKKWAIEYKRRVLGKPLGNYKLTVHNSALLVEKKFGKYYSSRTHHNIDSYLKSDMKHVQELFGSEIGATLQNHVRADNDIQRNIYSYVALAEHRGHLRYVGQRTSSRLHINRPNQYEKFYRRNPKFFCVNDSEFANDADREKAAEFLAELFPEPSSFELKA